MRNLLRAIALAVSLLSLVEPILWAPSAQATTLTIIMYAPAPNASFSVPSGNVYQSSNTNLIVNVVSTDVNALQAQGCVLLTPRNNVSATRAPLSTDDFTGGFGVGSQWIDVAGATPLVYVLTAMSTTPGSAIWAQVTSGSTSGTINAGATGQIGVYASPGGTIIQPPTANASGIDSISETVTWQGNIYFGSGKPWVDVRSGANSCGAAGGDAFTPDTIAINCQIVYLNGIGGGVVYFPPGTYSTSGNGILVYDNVMLVGAGLGASALQAASTFTGSISGTTLTTSGVVGTIALGTINGAGLVPGTQITAGSGPTYTVNHSQTVSAEKMWGQSDSNVVTFGPTGGTSCPSGNDGFGLQALAVYGYNAAAGTHNAVTINKGCSYLIRDARIWFGVAGVFTMGTDGLIDNTFICGSNYNVLSAGANWYVRDKLDACAAAATGTNHAFFQADPYSGWPGGPVENHFVQTDFSGAYNYSVYIDDSTSEAVTIISDSVMSSPIFVGNSKWANFSNAEIGSTNFVANNGVVTIANSYGLGGSTTPTGTAIYKCSNNYQITC